MGRRLFLLFVLIALAAPGAAQAGSKKVRVKIPHDGNLTVAQYKVTVGGNRAPTAKVLKQSRLGDTQAITSVTKLKGRSYEVTVYAVNPTGHASAALPPLTALPVEIRGIGKLTYRQLDTIPDVLDAQLDNYDDVERFCKSRSARAGVLKALRTAGIPKAEAKRIVKALKLYLCQDGTLQEVIEAWRTLEELLDMDLPSCFGTVSLDSPIEVAAHLTCMEPSQAFALYGPTGSMGTSCLGSKGSACSWGSGCAAFDPSGRAVCFSNLNGYPTGVQIQFNARYSEEVGRGGVPQITIEYLPKGSTSIGQKKPVYSTG